MTDVVVENVIENMVEINPIQVTETREQLRARLKEKIKGKRNNRTNGITRKRGNNINDSVKKIGDILTENKVENIEQINESLIQKIMSIISKDDLELVLQNMQQNSHFKEIMSLIKNKME